MVTQWINTFLLFTEQKLYYYVNKRPSLEPILSQFNPHVEEFSPNIHKSHTVPYLFFAGT